MRFTIKTWVSNNDNAKTGTIFSVQDYDKLGDLPVLPGGHWEAYQIANERTFKFAVDAKKAIILHGYYLLGAGEAPSEAFGSASAVNS